MQVIQKSSPKRISSKLTVFNFNCCSAFYPNAKNEVPLDHIAVNDCRYDEARTSYFVAGTLLEGEKFAKAQVIFNEESGIAEITLYEYTTPTFLGTRNFVAMIDTTTADSKEVWLKTEAGKLQVK